MNEETEALVSEMNCLRWISKSDRQNSEPTISNWCVMCPSQTRITKCLKIETVKKNTCSWRGLEPKKVLTYYSWKCHLVQLSLKAM